MWEFLLRHSYYNFHWAFLFIKTKDLWMGLVIIIIIIIMCAAGPN